MAIRTSQGRIMMNSRLQIAHAALESRQHVFARHRPGFVQHAASAGLLLVRRTRFGAIARGRQRLPPARLPARFLDERPHLGVRPLGFAAMLALFMQANRAARHAADEKRKHGREAEGPYPKVRALIKKARSQEGLW